MSTVSGSQPLMAPPQYAVGVPQAGSGPDGGDTASLSMGDALRIVKQRKWTIVITFIVVSMLVVAGTVATRLYFPLFTSRALLKFEPLVDPTELTDKPFDPRNIRVQLETEARQIGSPSMLLGVLERPEVKNTRYVKQYKQFDKLFTDFQAAVGVSPVPDSQLISISFSCGSPAEAQTITKALLDTFLARYNAQSRSELTSRLDELENTRDQLKSRLAETRTARSEHDLNALENERQIKSQEIATLTSTLSQLESELAQYEAELEGIQGRDLGTLPITASEKALIDSDPNLRFHERQTDSLDIEINAARAQLGPNHRQIKLLRERRNGHEEEARVIREQLIDQIRQRRYDELQQVVAQLRASQAKLLEQLSEAQAAIRDLDARIEVGRGLAADEEMITEQLAEIQRDVTAAQTLQASAQRRGRLKVAERPSEPREPSRPDLVMYLGGGFIFAMLSAFGMAFLRELADNTIRTPIDVVRHGHLSVLGSIPVLDDEEADVDDVEQCTRLAPHSLLAEGFRQVRTNLQFSGPPDSQRVLLITSPKPGDGKTTVAVNLAVVLAQGGQRVLLIDCNFRRPHVRECFRNVRKEGLSQILIGNGTLKDFVTQTEVPGLDVLGSGPMPPQPAELLGSEYMRKMIEEARQHYDRVVLDGPPALLISDALVLSRQVDGIVLVARAVNSSRGTLKRAREQMERIGARILGAVLNGAQARAGGYFRQQYREFYEYAEETIPPELEPPRDADA